MNKRPNIKYHRSAEDRAYNMVSMPDEAARFVREEFPDQAAELLGAMLVHGLPSNRANQSGWDDQYWCQCDKLLSDLKEQFDEWALSQTLAAEDANRREIAEDKAFNDVEWLL